MSQVSPEAAFRGHTIGHVGNFLHTDGLDTTYRKQTSMGASFIERPREVE
jgi:hypothetical protein